LRKMVGMLRDVAAQRPDGRVADGLRAKGLSLTAPTIWGA